MKRIFLILYLFLGSQLISLAQEITWSEPVNLSGLNSKSDEFAPVWNRFQKQLYFNSTSSGYSKFYYSSPDQNFNFTKFNPAEGEINQSRNNQSYITFESNEIAYFSTFRQYPGRSYMNIFQTRKKKNAWLKPFDADSLVYPVFMGHPSVSPDGSMMIFSTTLNSEFNDTDLWMAFKQENGTWGTLIQISALKTPGNEITPFIATNDTLYFASDGQEGPGGYDLFLSVRRDGIWQIPNPISSLNTEFDESDFTLLPNGKAIFASNRPGGNGGLDLYMTSIGKHKLISSPPTSIELSIAAQVPDIKIKGDINEAIAPAFTYFFFYKNEFLKPDFKFNNLLFLNNPDSIHSHSPIIISERIKKLKEHKLFITVFSNNLTGQEQENIKIKLLNLLNLTEERLAINFVTASEIQKKLFDDKISYMKFASNNEKVFSPVDISEYKMEVIPPALELSIDARPRSMIKNWECNLSIGDKFEKNIKTGNELPVTFFHNIKNYSKELTNSDSIIIKVSANDTLNNNHEFSQVFNVTHSNSKLEKFIIFKNKKYREYFLLIPDAREIREGKTYFNTFSVITEKAVEKKNIIIRSYSEDGKNIAEGIKSYIHEFVGGKDIEIKIDSEIKKSDFSNRPYGKFLLSILVEI